MVHLTNGWASRWRGSPVATATATNKNDRALIGSAVGSPLHLGRVRILRTLPVGTARRLVWLHSRSGVDDASIIHSSMHRAPSHSIGSPTGLFFLHRAGSGPSMARNSNRDSRRKDCSLDNPPRIHALSQPRWPPGRLLRTSKGARLGSVPSVRKVRWQSKGTTECCTIRTL